MSQDAQSEMLELIPLDLANLRRLAESDPVDLGSMEICEGALPPAQVVSRVLAQLDVGTPPRWCVPFLIVSRNTVLGTCRFRAAPVDGSVEIGYEVAESQRGRGIATAAVSLLLQSATSSGCVRRVVARILPDNVASSKVVSRLGFAQGGLLIDDDGETVLLWAIQVAT